MIMRAHTPPILTGFVKNINAEYSRYLVMLNNCMSSQHTANTCLNILKVFLRILPLILEG